MNDSAPEAPDEATPARPFGTVVVRAAIGGLLMGLANLVPGISGGTMLLAAGVYPAFIAAIADVTTLRFRLVPMVLLGTIVVSAGLAILLLAGATRTLVIEQRFAMYSLFIGLTLGGVPLVWRMARPGTPAVWGGAAAGFGLMLAMALGPTADGGGGGSTLLLVAAGAAGAGAMILPGVSGGYLLLLLGQYLPILAAIDQLKGALGGLGDGGVDMALLGEAAAVVVPVGIGVVVGIVLISNGLRWLLERAPKATLGFLLGLLVGAVVGLWPFQEGVPPAVGSHFKGRVVTAESLGEIDRKDYPLAPFAPTAGQAASSIALVLLGLAATLAIDRVGGGEGDEAGAAD